MKKCVIIGSHIPNQGAIAIGNQIFSYIHQYLGKDTDIYVGINPCALQNEWIEIVKKHAKAYEITPNNLVIISDASSYQSGIRAYWKDNQGTFDYDAVWFLHTQGSKRTSNHRIRVCHLERLLKYKDDTLNRLFSHDCFGGYATTLACYEKQDISLPIGYTLDRYYKLPYSPFQWLAIGAMYIIKGKILNNFLKLANSEFLAQPLTTYWQSKGWLKSRHTNGDPWFLERDFIQIVPRQGFIMLYDTTLNHYGKGSGSQLYIDQLKKWILDNKLDILDILDNKFLKEGRPSVGNVTGPCF